MHSLRVFLFQQRICLMSYRIEVAPEFARRLNKLSKRYKSIKQDYDFFYILFNLILFKE